MATATPVSTTRFPAAFSAFWAGAFLMAFGSILPVRAAEELSFSRDVQPILAQRCYACHGPDEEDRQADLRLDVRDVAVDAGAIVPGRPGDSELMRRILSDDPDVRMPPAHTGEALTADEQQRLRRWIEAGANYERHWAFVRPRRPPLPAVEDAAWPLNPIDRFVLARLEAEGLEPSPPADRYTLVRRVYLDLIGLPPTPEEADAFVSDDDPQAYEKLVDRLLDSPYYGERWARPWLDLARYADTNGYEKDRPRSIWPYRDWVIEALNDDMPFDRFTIEQLAGDMLPGATADQRIATGFHRNTMLNEEGGIDPLEFRFYAMVDRVATTGTVWMGLTTGCAQCHSHKYDPISHTDYYRLMALLNNADEPDLQIPDPDILKRRRQIETQIAELEAGLANQFPLPEDGRDSDDKTLDDNSIEDSGDCKPAEERRAQHLQQKFSDWLAAEHARAAGWTVLRPQRMESNLPKLELLDDGSIFSSGDITKRDVFTLTFRLDESVGPITALRLEALPDERLPAGGPGRAYYEGRQGDFFLSEVTAMLDGRPVAFAGASHSYGKISIGSGTANAENVIDGDGSTGWSTAGGEGRPHQLVLNLAQPLPPAGELTVELLFERHFAASLGRFRFSATSAVGDEPQARNVPVEIENLLAGNPHSWMVVKREQVQRQYLLTAPELAEARRPIDELRQELPALPTTLVLEERPPDNPRPTFRHHRGEYLSPREEVTPGVPEIFPPLPENEPADRLTFARWLVSDRNPLVGRVTVNRAWRALFGHGLMRTSGDFGTQSDPPTHPKLLDWLACEFVEGGWSLKRLHRLIVTTATYRQSSRFTPELLRRDPENRLLARGPRYRVEAEIVRDLALRASGLLDGKIGGPSVFPPQPESVTAVAYGGYSWQPSDPYRRSLYTFSKRTAPFAAYSVFDAPTGENCIPRRDRSNTPLQALTLLNDAMFLEAAQALAAMALEDDTLSPRVRAVLIFRRLLTRPPSEKELTALLEFQQAQQQRLEAGELDVTAIGGDQATPERAAWVMLARAVMNLDEAITKE